MEAIFTIGQKLEALEREIRQRLQVYPRLVATNKMRKSEAAREIAIMRAIAEDYLAQTREERLL